MVLKKLAPELRHTVQAQPEPMSQHIEEALGLLERLIASTQSSSSGVKSLRLQLADQMRHRCTLQTGLGTLKVCLFAGLTTRTVPTANTSLSAADGTMAEGMP